MPKISQYPSQSGAAVANGDLIPIVDVGSPNVTERITVDELAQAPQFSSRYAPLASDVIFITHAAFDVAFGSAANGSLDTTAGDVSRRRAALMFDASSQEAATGVVVIPQNWNTVQVYAWWSNAGAGSGDWTQSVYFKKMTNNGASNDGQTLASFALVTTAAAQAVFQRVTINASAWSVDAGGVYNVGVRRDATLSSDTLTNDMGFLGLEIVRLS